MVAVRTREVSCRSGKCAMGSLYCAAVKNDRVHRLELCAAFSGNREEDAQEPVIFMKAPVLPCAGLRRLGESEESQRRIGKWSWAFGYRKAVFVWGFFGGAGDGQVPGTCLMTDYTSGLFQMVALRPVG